MGAQWLLSDAVAAANVTLLCDPGHKCLFVLDLSDRDLLEF